ncbi:hypothetical protein ACOTU8_04250, partial [Campylobacter jejuni]
MNIDTFINDSNGVIQSNSRWGTVHVQNSIKTFTNAGTITNTGNLQPGTYINVSAGVYLQEGLIETFTNSGLISGIMGLNLIKSTINTLINTGIIESTSSNSLAAGISIATLSGSPSTINNF